MGKIVILDENTANKIAAGEVVERPASVVKELIENSLDAGATAISIEVKNGGISYMKVMDNGSGMEEDDVGIAFERHATSKIRKADDIENISSMGFRGEALASIAAVSAVQLVTKTGEKAHGTSIEIQGGNIIDIKPTGCPVGTTITVKNLFYNTPARFKFLKKDTTEAGYISDVISRIALGNPDVSFKLTSNNTTVLHTPGNNDYLSSIFSVYGKDTAKDVHEVKYEDTKIKITGYVGKPEIARSNRNQQTIFINKRLIRSKMISSAIDEAYSTFLMKNKFAFAVLNLELNPVLVDVNVHPSKMEVKFSNEQDIFRAVYNAVNNALLSRTQIRSVQPEAGFRTPYTLDASRKSEAKYSQQTMNYDYELVKKETPVVKETIQEYKPYGNLNSTYIPEFKAQNKPEESYPKKSNNITNIIEPLESKKMHVASDISVKIINTKGYSTEVPPEKNITEHIIDTIFETDTIQEKEITEPVKNEHVQLKDAIIIGQAFNTYILLQLEDQLILMDQHAAHERIVYEELKEKYSLSMTISQTLLSTFVIELTHREIKFLEEEKDFFSSIGFDYEVFGSNSILLRSAPLTVNDNVREIFLELLDFMTSSGRTDRKLVADEALYRIACKAAVKANMKLNELEIKNLLKKLSALENPYTCPHGRPSAIKMSKYELEKMFKRIV